jgi:phospholipase/carboxylesterase
MTDTHFELPERTGPAPQVNPGMPHLQLTDNADDDVYAALADWLFSLDGVEEGRSRVSIPSSRAAWINELPINPIAQREFTHIHTEPGPGSQHIPLTAAVAEEVLAKGWGEPHPTNPYIHDFELLMIYAPRTEEELEAVKAIIDQAYRWTLLTSG